MGNPQIYCSLCGAPMWTSGDFKGDPREWLTKAILLTTAHQTDNGLVLDEYWPRRAHISTTYPFNLGPDPPKEAQRSVLRLEAHAHGTTSFDLRESGECVRAMCVEIERKSPGPLDHGGLLYLPLHSSCLELADRFVDSIQNPVLPVERITSIKQLWEVLYRRLCGDSGGRTWELPEPHDYFGGRRCRNVEWEVEDDPEHGRLHEQNPIEIQNLTESILQNLLSVPFDNDKCAISKESEDLESAETSSKAYRNPQNADLNCDYEISQDWWYERFVNRDMFPWLWDLDVAMIHEKQQSGRWNWELLARQLSQVKIHEPNDDSLKLPLALRNRRRIWRLIEEARVDDIAGPAEEKIAALVEERKRQVNMWSPAEFNSRLPFPLFSPKKPDT